MDFAIPTPPHATALEYLRDTGDGADSNQSRRGIIHISIPKDVGGAMQ